MVKARIMGALLAMAFIAALAPASAQVVTTPAPVVVVEPAAPVVVTEPVTVVDEAQVVVVEKTWIDYVQEGALGLLALFGAALAAAIVALGIRIFPSIGKAMDETRRARIEELLLNGMYWAVNLIKSKGGTPTKSEVKMLAVGYAADHGKAEFKKLGVDPTTTETKMVLEGHAERILANPAVTTPMEITPDGGKAPVTVIVGNPAPGA